MVLSWASWAMAYVAAPAARMCGWVIRYRNMVTKTHPQRLGRTGMRPCQSTTRVLQYCVYVCYPARPPFLPSPSLRLQYLQLPDPPRWCLDQQLVAGSWAWAQEQRRCCTVSQGDSGDKGAAARARGLADKVAYCFMFRAQLFQDCMT